jgi:hypothetical protein
MGPCFVRQTRAVILRIVTYLVVALATHYFASLIQIVCHRLFGHTRRIDKLFRIHTNGHHAKYPPTQLRSAVWIRNEEHITWYYGIAFAPFLVACYAMAPLDVFVVFVLSLLASIGVHIYLHRQYHAETTWLIRFRWFRRKQHLHFVHHRSVTRNYAIVEFFWDRLLRTYSENL